jgi:outer membrane protein assembly factor BamB
MRFGSPAIGIDGTIYIGTADVEEANGMYAVNGSTGDVIWKYTIESSIKTTPAIDADGTLYFGATDGIFYAISSFGSLRWKYVTGICSFLIVLHYMMDTQLFFLFSFV